EAGLRSLVVAPLLVEKRVFGVLVAARRASDSFSSPECEFLRQLSEHVALAAHQAQLYGALQRAYDDLRQAQQAMMQQGRLRALGSGQAQQRGVFIQLKTELAESLPGIMGSEVEIRDALTNLIFNAMDAMPQGGTLTLRTRLVSSGGDITRQVQVEVADTGIG